MSVTVDSITKDVVVAVLRKLMSMGTEYVGGFAVDKINIVPSCDDGQLAYVSTKDAYDPNGNLKPDGKPDSFTICLDKLVSSARESMDDWLKVYPEMKQDFDMPIESFNSPLLIILALLGAEMSAHEEGHLLPPSVDVASGVKVPNLSDEGAAESAAKPVVDKLMRLLYQNLTPEVLGVLDDNTSDNNIYASFSDSLKTMGSIREVRMEKLLELKSAFGSELSDGGSFYKIKRHG